MGQPGPELVFSGPGREWLLREVTLSGLDLGTWRKVQKTTYLNLQHPWKMKDLIELTIQISVSGTLMIELEALLLCSCQ